MGSFNFCKKRSQRYKIKKHGSFSNSNSQSRLPLLLERRSWYPSTFPTVIYQIYYFKCKSIIECIKALQRKLQNETQLRESFVQNSQIEKTAQNKKIDGLISRLNLLRTDLRRGITGMNAALNPKTEKPVESAAAGDA